MSENIRNNYYVYNQLGLKAHLTTAGITQKHV